MSIVRALQSILLLLVSNRYTQDYTAINLTKLDVLDTFPSIKVAIAYVTSKGERLTSFPADLNLLEKCTVEYQDFPGWQSSTQGIREWSKLPENAQKYVDFIGSTIGVKIGYIGTGPDREDMIVRK